MCKGGNFPCYAYRLANTRLRDKYRNNAGNEWVESESDRRNIYLPFWPRFWWGKLTEPRYREKPAGIFTCDMGDLFGVGIPRLWTSRVLDVVKDNPQHRFYLLTKQPQNLKPYSPFPPNAWVGVTATDTAMLMRACSYLEDVRVKIKYLSLEPLLSWEFNWEESYLANILKRAKISWVIIGAQTKPTKLPDMEWVESIIAACDRARTRVKVKVFLKNNLRPLIEAGDLRQEMPG